MLSCTGLWGRGHSLMKVTGGGGGEGFDTIASAKSSIVVKIAG